MGDLEVSAAPNGHTFRYFGKRSNEFILERKPLRVDRIQERSRIEIAVTEIDSFFEDNFAWASMVNYSAERSLSTRDLWEHIVNKLHEISLKTTVSFSQYYGGLVYRFDIPILGHEIYNNSPDNDQFMGTSIIDSKERKKLKPGWLRWNNNVYSPEFIYDYFGNEEETSGTLKKLFPVDWAAAEIPNSVCVQEAAFGETRRGYYEIDLGEPMFVTHVGTFGSYPKVFMFPSKTRLHSYWQFRSSPYNRRNGWVKVRHAGENYSWISKYAVYYRDVRTGKWVVYSSGLEGNDFIYPEKVNAVSAYSRYLRVVPLERGGGGNPGVRINVYATDLSVERLAKESEKKREVGSETTVQYTLYPQSTLRQRVDGSGYQSLYHWSEYYTLLAEERKAVKDDVLAQYKEYEDLAHENCAIDPDDAIDDVEKNIADAEEQRKQYSNIWACWMDRLEKGQVRECRRKRKKRTDSRGSSSCESSMATSSSQGSFSYVLEGYSDEEELDEDGFVIC